MTGSLLSDPLVLVLLGIAGLLLLKKILWMTLILGTLYLLGPEAIQIGFLVLGLYIFARVLIPRRTA